MKELDCAYEFFLAGKYAQAIDIFNQLLTKDLSEEIRKNIFLLAATVICFAVKYEAESCVII